MQLSLDSDCGGVTCGDLTSNYINEYCEAPPESIYSYESHASVPALGAATLMNSLPALAGSPSPLQIILMGDEVEYSSSGSALWGFVVAFLIIGIIWGLMIIACIIASCCPSCRNAVFCGRCCHDRPRVAPMYAVPKWKIGLNIATAGVVVILGGTAVGLTVGGFIGRLNYDVKETMCNYWLSTFDLLYGTQRGEKQWDGFYGWNDTLQEMKGKFEPDTGEFAMKARAATEAAVERLKTNAEALLLLADNFSEYAVRPTLDEFAIPQPWDGEDVALLQLPLGCALFNMTYKSEDLHQILAEGNKAMDALKATVVDYTGEGSYLMSGMDAIYAMEETFNVIANGPIETYWESIEEYWDVVLDGYLGGWTTLIILASLGFVPITWALVMVVILLLNFVDKTEPNLKRTTRSFCGLWITFGLYGFLVFSFGVVMAMLVEVGAVGCKLAREEWLLKGSYADYPMIFGKDNMTLDLLESCLSADGDGDIVKAVGVRDQLEEVDDAIEAVKVELKANFETLKESAIQPAIYDAIGAANSVSWMVMPDLSQLKADEILLAVAYEEALLGGVNKQKHETPPAIKQLLTPLLLDTIAEMKDFTIYFDKRDVMEEIESAINDWDWTFGLQDLERRLSSAASGASCGFDVITDWCIAASGSGRVCKEEATITADTQIRIGSSSGPVGYDLPSEVWMVSTCLAATDDNDATINAHMFATGVYWAAQKSRVIAADADGQFPFVKDKRKNRTIPYDKFSPFVRLKDGKVTGAEKSYFVTSLNQIGDAMTNIIETIVDVEASTVALLTDAQNDVKSQLDNFNCSALYDAAQATLDVMCYDVFGDQAILAGALLLMALISLVGWIATWKQWHYWSDRQRLACDPEAEAIALKAAASDLLV